MRERLRKLWRRARTTARCMQPEFRVRWRRHFLTAGSLHTARFYAERPQLGHTLLAHQAMARLYNDATPGGFMSAAQAGSIYEWAPRRL